jgi:hypothetical protein
MLLHARAHNCAFRQNNDETQKKSEKEFISMMLLQHLKGRVTTIAMVTIVVVMLIGEG